MAGEALFVVLMALVAARAKDSAEEIEAEMEPQPGQELVSPAEVLGMKEAEAGIPIQDTVDH